MTARAAPDRWAELGILAASRAARLAHDRFLRGVLPLYLRLVPRSTS